MAFVLFPATVIDSQRISPSFQRVRLSGLKRMGPQTAIRDLRIKLILPGEAGLPQLPQNDWYPTWRVLDPATRGYMRTYSVRDFDRTSGILTIDFVLHTAPGQSGPASTWAATTHPGDEILVIAPELADASGAGIEFDPGKAPAAHLYGDETALPAIARIVQEWPADLRGSIHLEVPYYQDQQRIVPPFGVDITWLPRGRRPHGEALVEAMGAQLGIGKQGSAEPDTERLWETPAGQVGADSDYWWVAGESGVVKQLRRMLVKQAGVPKDYVSFMGYWKRGAAEN